ncbi:hypothetical protein K5X82_17885 [Halosquirtibacter xylanolyticus]|uniref:hypothetical protein n=1 Tax=Halosquirtibacter xylanolyticus TaxID=3374599 RepID=UPI003748CFFB|nr:hypothetical protein K5X82_17885 [Prolixibacteraceae bacterium]
MLSILILFILLLVVTALIIVEVGILPGLSISGIFALLVAAFALYYSYISYGIWGTTITLIAYAAIIPFLVKYIMEKNKHLFPKLNTTIDGVVNPLKDITVNIGDHGVSETRMAPVGFSILNNQRIQTYSIERVIDRDIDIEVVKIENNKVYVKPVESDNNN